jgi:hypothetical protein
VRPLLSRGPNSPPDLRLHPGPHTGPSAPRPVPVCGTRRHTAPARPAPCPASHARPSRSRRHQAGPTGPTSQPAVPLRARPARPSCPAPLSPARPASRRSARLAMPSLLPPRPTEQQVRGIEARRRDAFPAQRALRRPHAAPPALRRPRSRAGPAGRAAAGRALRQALASCHGDEGWHRRAARGHDPGLPRPCHPTPPPHPPAYAPTSPRPARPPPTPRPCCAPAQARVDPQAA